MSRPDPGLRIVEVFSSLQGEGLCLGQRQIFVRLAGCALACDYCDQPEAQARSAGERWGFKRLQDEIKKLQAEQRHAAVSWTGGEPLLQLPGLLRMLAWTKDFGLANHLETNGTLVAAFRKAAHLCDTVSADIKLPSSTGKATWSEHLEFLRVAPEKTFVKVVLTKGTADAEWRQTIRLLVEASPDMPLVLQPATARAGIEPIEPERCLRFLRQARAYLKDVRLIPQWHPIWGVR
ncbi:MAG: 7-carboxy-7-deazaguanine synthase QueE [Elusimicrobia bacterium]|nr:7-carboxy-7-deazaguanine synthase QueE [Elusimicrobiota bacterium]